MPWLHINGCMFDTLPLSYAAEVQRGRFSLLLELARQGQGTPVLAHVISKASSIGTHLQAGIRSSDSLDRKRARQALEYILQLPLEHCSPPSAGWKAFLSMFDGLDMYDVNLVRGAWQPHWRLLLQSCYSLQEVSQSSGEQLSPDPEHVKSGAPVGDDATHQLVPPKCLAAIPAGIEREGPQWQWIVVLFERAMKHDNTAVQRFAAQALISLSCTSSDLPCSSAGWLSTTGARLLMSPQATPEAFSFVHKV